MASNKVPNRQVSLDSRRIRLEREVKIRVPQFDTFVTEYSSNISTTGMFILTNNPKPPGTVVAFEFSVADDWKLIRGQAQVVWVRHRAEGPEQPPGMGVRFVELDGQSRRLIRWIVEKHIREGGKPFELEELRTVIDEALDQVLDTKEAPTAIAGTPARRTPVPAKTMVQRVSRSRQDSHLMPLLITAVVVVALVAVLFWLTEYLPRSSGDGEQVAATSGEGTGEAQAGAGGDGEPTTPGDDDAATNEGAGAGEERAAGAAGDGDEARQAADDIPPVGSAYADVTGLVESWSDAWSDQNVDRYLSFYARSFRPTNGSSRASWAAQRRERIERPGYIRIAISGLEMDRVDDGRVVATFFQGYRSDRFRDEVRKRLELVWEDGAWRIAREVTL